MKTNQTETELYVQLFTKTFDQVIIISVKGIHVLSTITIIVYFCKQGLLIWVHSFYEILLTSIIYPSVCRPSAALSDDIRSPGNAHDLISSGAAPEC